MRDNKHALVVSSDVKEVRRDDDEIHLYHLVKPIKTPRKIFGRFIITRSDIRFETDKVE